MEMKINTTSEVSEERRGFKGTANRVAFGQVGSNGKKEVRIKCPAT
jgi:hypothetical protein